VPFQLGHPLGAPDNPAFQRRVLLAVLGLFEFSGGPPLLTDFPDDEPQSDEITVLACPVNFYQDVAKQGETDPLQAAFRREMAAMRPWYEMALAKRQRTTVGVSRIDIGELADFIYAFLQGAPPENPRDDIPLVYTLKLAIEDLKAYYTEGVTAQPGQAGASSQVLQDWFWEETAAGRVLLALKKVCEASNDRMTSVIGAHFIVPGDVARRHKN
jgi:hypothetical protein